jgi:hypothetical protein
MAENIPARLSHQAGREGKAASTRTQRPKTPPETPPGPYRMNPLSWLILGLLFAWNVWSFLPRSKPEVALPYSEFVSQVASGNVVEVRIVGADITGTLKRAIVWPEADATAPPKIGTAASNAKETGRNSSPKELSNPAARKGGEAKPALTRPLTQSSPSTERGPAKTKVATASKTPPSAVKAESAKPATPASAPTAYTRFRTTFPSLVGDASLMPLLGSRHVVIDVATPARPWFLIILTDGLPVVLMVALLVWMGRQASRTQSGMFGFARNKARRYSEDRPEVTFADVAGADEAKSDLTEVVE